MNKKVYLILLSTLIICILLGIIEQVLNVNYLTKTLSKISLIFLNIFIFYLIYKDKIIYFKTSKMSKKDWIKSLLLGSMASFLIILAYLIVFPFLDLENFKNDLTGRLGITPVIFIYVGIYITFVNSFIEETYFRGFIFYNLPKKLGYIYSPLLFASYHIPMIFVWFDLIYILICFIGLWLIALIFHKINEKHRNIYSSWLVHILADITIILIGITIIN